MGAKMVACILVPQGFAGRIDLSVPTERTDECRFIQSCASQSSCARWGKATVRLGFGDGSDNSKIRTLAGAMIQFQAGGNDQLQAYSVVGAGFHGAS